MGLVKRNHWNNSERGIRTKRGRPGGTDHNRTDRGEGAEVASKALAVNVERGRVV